MLSGAILARVYAWNLGVHTPIKKNTNSIERNIKDKFLSKYANPKKVIHTASKIMTFFNENFFNKITPIEVPSVMLIELTACAEAIAVLKLLKKDKKIVGNFTNRILSTELLAAKKEFRMAIEIMIEIISLCA